MRGMVIANADAKRSGNTMVSAELDNAERRPTEHRRRNAPQSR
jgi:hypothetical protein